MLNAQLLQEPKYTAVSRNLFSIFLKVLTTIVSHCKSKSWLLCFQGIRQTDYKAIILTLKAKY